VTAADFETVCRFLRPDIKTLGRTCLGGVISPHVVGCADPSRRSSRFVNRMSRGISRRQTGDPSTKNYDFRHDTDRNLRW
jgi:hypothetical protein